MSKTFTSMEALKAAIQKEIKEAMTEVANQSFLNVHQNVDSFYAFGGGGQYQRTGQLAESPEVRLSGDGDNYNFGRGVVRKEGRYVPSIRFGKRMNRVAQEKADEGEEEVE